MKITVVANLDGATELLRRRGLEPNGRVQKLFTAEVYNHCQDYTPFQQGVLAHGPANVVGDDYIIYNTPYARNMYYGRVMVDPVTGAAGFMTDKGWRSRRGVKKVASNRTYNYHGAPKRGPFWDKRMWADKKRVIVANVAKVAGGKPG